MLTHLPGPLMPLRWVWRYLSTGLDAARLRGPRAPIPSPEKGCGGAEAAGAPLGQKQGQVAAAAARPGTAGTATSEAVGRSFSERHPHRRRGQGRSALGAPGLPQPTPALSVPQLGMTPLHDGHRHP